MSAEIILFSDTHEQGTLENWRALCDKRFVGLINSFLIRRGKYDSCFLPMAIEYILDTKPECAVFTGDATSCGQPGEFAKALKIFRPLLRSRIPFLYIPGNHDAYVRDHACVSALRRFTFEMNRKKQSPEDYPFLTELEHFRIVSMNCVRPCNPVLSCGIMNRKTVDFLKNECAVSKGKPLIAAGHFPILIRENFVSSLRRGLYGAGEVRSLLAEGKIALSLCGHVHKPVEKLDQRGHGEIISGSLSKYGVISKITYEPSADSFRLERIFLKK